MLPEHPPLPPAPNEVNVARVRAAYDLAAEQYDSAYTHPKDEAENRFVLKTLQPLIVQPVLDAGCGTGFLLDRAAIDAANYLGVDISPGMLAKAQQKHPRHTFVATSMEDTGLAGGAFGSVVSLFGCFNYLLQPVTAVTEFARLLKPDGTLFMLVCTPRHHVRASYVLGKQGTPVPRRLYTAAEVYALLLPWFVDIKITGMSYVIDWLPKWTPQWAADLVMWAEQRLFSTQRPDEGYYLMVTARKVPEASVFSFPR